MTKKRVKPIHHAEEFGLDVTNGDDDMFRWFLLCYLFGKPIQSGTAVNTWKLFIDEKLDNPWTIQAAGERKLTQALHNGGYTRYEHVTARGLLKCMQQLIRDYDGSLLLMLEYSENEDEFSKRLQKLYGVGPKTAEIYLRETQELFARRVE
jgi:endonuclease III